LQDLPPKTGKKRFFWPENFLWLDGWSSGGFLRNSLISRPKSRNAFALASRHQTGLAPIQEGFQMRLLSLFLLMTSFPCAPAFADFVNGGFEQPAISEGSFTEIAFGWSNGGVWNIYPGYGFFDAEAPEGTQIGFSNNNAMAQQTARVLTQDSITLQAIAGRRSDSFAGSFRMELWAGGTVVTGNISGGTLLSFVEFDHTLIAPSSFLDIETTYTPSPGDPLIGQLLSARFLKTSGIQMNMDHVRFSTVAVPEPSSIFLASLIGLAVGFPNRHRRTI
jgi:hypothetical protein